MNKGKICVSVCAGTVDEIIVQIRRAEKYADVIEVRFDCLENTDFRLLFDRLPQTKKTYLFTFRPKEHGGKRDITIGERLKFWEYAIYSQKAGSIIDIEFDHKVLDSLTPSKIERILSMHDFAGSKYNLESTWKMMSQTSGSTVKIAVQADNISASISVWKLLELTKARGKNIIPIAMGEAGKWTRILGLAHGSYMTYASLDEGLETAAGQITARDLAEIFRVKELDLNTKVYGVIGDPVYESLSPYIHNPTFASENVNAVFLPLQVKDLDEFMRRMVHTVTREVELNFGGFAVTMPHKQAIIKHLDEIESNAEEIGAVNTLKIDGGKLKGYNTDCYGFVTPLREKFGDLKGARVAVFGAGGGARACVFALKQENADVTVFARDMQKGNKLADDLTIPFQQVTADHPPLTSDVDIVVNATPLGMKGPFENESLFTADQLKGVKFIYDLVTRRSDTPIIREAKKANIPAISGLEMLIHQGAKQFEIWTGREAPIDLMRRSAEERTR